jgi:hypothetical protein
MQMKKEYHAATAQCSFIGSEDRWHMVGYIDRIVPE